MKTVILAIAIAAMLITSYALAAPSPALNMPFDDWNLGNEPALKGGAKSIELVNLRNGTPSRSKYIISLDSSGNYRESKLATEGSDKSYVKTYRRDAVGNLQSVTQTIMEGETSKVNSRETATYKDSKLSAIAAERCLSKPTLQPEATITVATATDGKRTITVTSPKGKIQMAIALTYGNKGRVTKMAITRGGRTQEGTVERNADGLVTEVANDRATIHAVYEMDEKGNWTKATVATTRKSADGTERKSVREVARKIVY
jgi:hypothetical protein